MCNLADAKPRPIGQENLFLAGGLMEYEDQKTDHRSWMEWINLSIENAKEFYKEVRMNLGEITRQIVTIVIKESRFFISKLTPVDFFCGSITLGIISFASLFLVAGFGVVSYQVFLWIKNGVWSEFTIKLAFNFLFEGTSVAQWLNNPESWFGLQKITEWLLENIPLSVALIVPSIFTLVGMMCITIAALAFRFYQFKTEKKLNPI